jgi:hypothetical protein
MNVEKFLIENQRCYDRFTFDKVFRFLLSNDFTDEEAKDIILFNCSLSTLVFQERINNYYYKTIKVNEEISGDLLDLKKKIAVQLFEGRSN